MAGGLPYQKGKLWENAVISYLNSNGLFIEFHISLLGIFMLCRVFQWRMDNKNVFIVICKCNNYKKEDKLIQKEDKMSMLIIISYSNKLQQRWYYILKF